MEVHLEQGNKTYRNSINSIEKYKFYDQNRSKTFPNHNTGEKMYDVEENESKALLLEQKKNRSLLIYVTFKMYSLFSWTIIYTILIHLMCAFYYDIFLIYFFF